MRYPFLNLVPVLLLVPVIFARMPVLVLVSFLRLAHSVL